MARPDARPMSAGGAADRLGCYTGVAVPDAMTAVSRKSPLSRTMSADRPGARAPVSADRPRRRAGVVLAAAATSGTGRPTAVVAWRTTWSIVAVEPAIAPRGPLAAAV